MAKKGYTEITIRFPSSDTGLMRTLQQVVKKMPGNDGGSQAFPNRPWMQVLPFIPSPKARKTSVKVRQALKK